MDRYKKIAKAIRDGRTRARSRRAAEVEAIVARRGLTSEDWKPDKQFLLVKARIAAAEEKQDIAAAKASAIRQALQQFLDADPKHLRLPAKTISQRLRDQSGSFFTSLPYRSPSKFHREVAIALAVIRPKRKRS